MGEATSVREVAGAPAPDPVDMALLESSAGTAILRFPAAASSGGGQVEARFEGVWALTFGWPNDEALNGHPLWGRGLRHYTIQEVFNSSWIAELERRNAVHPQHLPGAFRDCRHIIITFKEDTFECVCSTMSLSHTCARPSV